MPAASDADHMSVQPPPPADLSAGLDGNGPRGADPLAGLDDVAWDRLEGPYDGGRTVRAMLIGLAAPVDGAWSAQDQDHLWSAPIHQSTCYPTTAPAATFVARIYRQGGLPHRPRLQLLNFLVAAADLEGLYRLMFPDDRPAQERGGAHDDWETHTRAAISAELGALLDSWDDEPIAVRYQLAALAAHFPDQAVAVHERVDALTAALAGTAHGAVLQIAHALLVGDHGAAAAQAREVDAWGDFNTTGVDLDGAPSELLAAHVLTEAAGYMLPG